MTEAVIKQGFAVVKQYTGVAATLRYSAGTDKVILTLESRDKITAGMIQRALMDFKVDIVESQVVLDKKQQFVVQWKSSLIGKALDC